MPNENTPRGTTLLRRTRVKKGMPPPRRPPLRRLPDTPILRQLCGNQAAFFHVLDELREFTRTIHSMGNFDDWLDQIDQILLEFNDLHDEFGQEKIDARELAERWWDEIALPLQEFLDHPPLFGEDKVCFNPAESNDPVLNGLVEDFTNLVDAKCEKINVAGYEFYDAISDYHACFR